MSVLLQSLLSTGKLYQIRKCGSICSFKNLLYRYYSDNLNSFLLFDDVVNQRRTEAQRSLVIRVNSESSFGELYNYCSKYAEVNGIHHYKNTSDEHFMLVEFGSDIHVQDVVKNCCTHQKDPEIMPVKSPFLWFKAKAGKRENILLPSDVALITKDGTMAVDDDVLLSDMLQCATVSEQIQLLYDRTVLNDLGVRLRYMVARQLETLFESLYTNVVVRPFGSSVNGFGKAGCDLDLVLSNANGIKGSCDKDQNEKRLVYQEKKCEGRTPFQKHMELVADLLEARTVGATRVLRILNARVPIVKYTHEMTGVDCDLCYNNMSGVYMSELLWLYGSMDDRVRPLTFVVRRWAQVVGLTNPHPGRWITNFPLTLMVLFFLQQKSKDGVILPPLKYLVKSAGKEDIRLAEDNLNCTFLRNLNKLPVNSYGNNPASLEELLLQFFEFYAQFDFHEKAISINEAVPIRKPNNSPLYIVNPLDQSLNVSRNVSYDECERLILEVRNAAWQLQTSSEGSKSGDWGILCLIERLASRSLKNLIKAGNSRRMVSVKDLFNDETEDVKDSEVSNRLQRLSVTSLTHNNYIKDTKGWRLSRKSRLNQEGDSTERDIKYKNEEVRRQVRWIRRNKMI